ncbi:MAG: FHA domain-containing protein [Chlorobiota bacterium]|nr:MAG: FHA domain-containing protein [Chlorobiota bacterium]
MKCPECGKETPPNKSHCQECGAKLKTEFKTCANGHQFSGDRCPYCPADDLYSGVPTVIDETGPSMNDDRTRIDQAAPSIRPAAGGLDDRTQIVTSQAATAGGPTLPPLGSAAANPVGRKIVGFLVSYDLDPLGTVFNIYEGRNLVGRVAPASVLIPDTTVSDKHALILFRDGKFFLADELSTNGTFVNDEAIEDKVKLSDRDEVRFGKVIMRFIII